VAARPTVRGDRTDMASYVRCLGEQGRGSVLNSAPSGVSVQPF
jgi:hypothetical protein